MIGVQAQVEPANEGIYYLYNTETGKLLTRGNNWGTQCVTNDFGSPWKVYIADGKYTLRMYDIVTADGNTNRALGSNGFADNDKAAEHEKFTLTGNVNGYTLSDGDKKLVSPSNYGENVLATSGNSTWQFLNTSQYNAILAAKISAQESAIATTAGVDISGSSLGAVVNDDVNWRRTDVSKKVAFPSNTSWARTGVPNRAGAQNQGNYGVERYEGGGAYTYTVTGLDKGIYKVGIKAMFRSTNNATCSTIGEAGYVNSSAYLNANGNLVQIKDWYSSRVSASNPNSTDEFVAIANNGGYLSEVYTYVGDDGKLDLSAVSESYWGASWFLFNGITLTYYSNAVSDEDVNALIETIPSHVSDAHASAMATAKTALENDKTIANYNALAAAIEAAQTSASEYAIIDGGFVPTNTTAGWAKSTTNGALACNTWSTEGNSDGSGMKTPFIQDWVASGTPLAGGNADGKLYFSFTDLNPGETYVVTARVRAFNESATGVTGAKYFVGSSSKPLDEVFSSPCVGDYATKGRFAVLSCAGTVDSNGDLQFGVELDAESPINWISIKDVTISAGTGAVPTAIELSETSKSLTTGSSFVLTSTIAPANADDKTTLWSSSDNTVATVAGGTVVALKAGTATITATAYAGDNVKASCTVTIADAAAPSFYSTSIEAKDYYIYNAATGQFLGGANSWGTQASQIEHGIPFTAAIGEGVYTLDSHTYNNANDHFFNGTYVDGASTNLYITPLTDGKFAISTAASAEYVTAIAGSTVVANSAENADNSLAQWYFLSKEDRDKMLPAATALSPVDATYYVKQANISRNLSAGTQGQNAWSQYDVGGDQNNSNLVAQVYNKNVDNYQTIENIPNGTYTVSVQAFTSGSNVKFYANNQKVDVQAKPDEVTTCAQASKRFAAKSYSNTVSVTVTNRTLKIGFEGDCTGKWLCYDNVEVYMTNYAADPTPAEKAALVAAIEAAETHTLGFENAEYAPYVNVDAVTKLLAAKAIDPEIESGEGIVAATEALNNATWTANSGDVEAVYNGNFAEGQSSAAAEIQQYGWTRTNGWGQFLNDAATTDKTAYYNQPGSMQYGKAGGYLMPLKANTIYRLQFKYGYKDQDVTPTVSVLCDEDGMAAQAFAKATSSNTYTTSMISVDMVFVTGKAGNYILSITGDKNLVMTDVSITKAASQTLTFADDAAMPKYAPGTYPSVKITRTLTANKWATAVYPFAVSGVDNIAVLDSYSSETGIIGFATATESKANEPFLMRSTEGTTEISLSNVAVAATAAEPVVTKNKATLKGVYASGKVPVSEDDNVRYVVSGNQLYKVDSDVNIKPFRAYFEFIGNNEARPVLRFDDTTAINAIEAAEAESGALKDGKYIIDNKVVIVKNGVKYGANGQKLN